MPVEIVQQRAPSEPSPTTRVHWTEALAAAIERYVPDATTTSILLLVVLFVLALAVGAPASQAFDAYYQGLWSLLAFTMQMTLILVLSLMLGATRGFREIIRTISRYPKTPTQVVVVAVLCGSCVAYLNWGLSLAIGPVIAIYFCREAERKGIAVDFLVLVSTISGVRAIWQLGLSGSAPLLMATPGHFLEETTGVMPLTTTIWSPAAIAIVLVHILACMVMGILLMPRTVRPLSRFPDAERSVSDAPRATAPSEKPATFAQRLEHNPFVMLPLVVMLAAWLYTHFFVRNQSLDINAMNTSVLLLAVVLHRNVAGFTRALREAAALAWPIVLLYHLYAGVAGLLQFTPVGDFLITLFNPILTQYTYPLLTTSISTIVALFIPTSGGQWLMQGYITVETAALAGLSPQRGLVALSVGDHMGNLLAPFWSVVIAGIARVDFRALFGYQLIYAALWFTIGVLCVTFLPV
jgi:short-chain fatty acids transporter